jgi:ActR/RegA family two-component response regulator
LAVRSDQVTIRATGNEKTEQPKILVVDENEHVRASLDNMLEFNQLQITTARNVSDALHLIDADSFDVLLSDWRMTEAGDGLAMVSAMHNTNRDALTLVYTGYPELENALDVVLSQANETMVKPMAIPALITTITEKLQERGTRKTTNIERVAAILARDAVPTINDWLVRVEREPELTCVPLSREERTGHLPKLMQELVHRLRVARILGTKVVSEAAAQHGKDRFAQGYSIPMIIEESRILQVSIFHTLQNNLGTVAFSLLLADVMTIADEVDSQLKQTVISYMGQTEKIAA